jgi:hypothetical protein
MRIKPGMESQVRQIIEEQARLFEAGQVAGFVASYSYRMDADPNNYNIAAVFSSRGDNDLWTNKTHCAIGSRHWK